MRPRRREDSLERLLPGMERQIEGAIVDRHEPPSAQIQVGLQGLLRQHVHVGPARVVRAGLHQRQVEGAEAIPDGLEAGEIAGVAAEEEAQVIVDQHPRRPQRAVAVGQRTAREMLRGRRRELQTADRGGLPPVELPHLVRGHAPVDEPIADAQGREEVLHPGRECPDGVAVEMVVVVMREDHALDVGQVRKRDGRRVEALRSDPLHRRGALREDRVREPEAARSLSSTVEWPRRNSVRSGACSSWSRVRGCVGSARSGTVSAGRLKKKVHIRPSPCQKPCRGLLTALRNLPSGRERRASPKRRKAEGKQRCTAA